MSKHVTYERPWPILMTAMAMRRGRGGGEYKAMIEQMETMSIVTLSPLRMGPRTRLHYDGTNRGNVISTIVAPSWTDKTTVWHETVGTKKELFTTAHRLPPSGSHEVLEDAVKRDNADLEPAFFHAAPLQLWQELIHSYAIGSVIDLSVGDGRAALAALAERVPYVGVTLSEKHAELVTQRLQLEVFRLMQDAQSPFHQPGLVAALGQTAEADGVATPKKVSKACSKPPAAKKRKSKAEATPKGKAPRRPATPKEKLLADLKDRQTRLELKEETPDDGVCDEETKQEEEEEEADTHEDDDVEDWADKDDY